MTTYNDLVQYFESLTVIGLNTVIVGNDEALLDLQATRIKYGCLWVETPQIRFAGVGDEPTTQYRFAIVSLINEPKKENKEANKKLSEAMTLLERIYAQLIADADDDQFELLLTDVSGEPIRAWSGDNCYGWRMPNVTIVLPRCECE